MGPLEQELDLVAERVGWRLVWETEPMPAHPSLTRATLEIFKGRRPVTADGPVWCIGSANAASRETIADAVLSAIPGRPGGRR